MIPIARSAHPVQECAADSKWWQGSAACGDAEASAFFSPEGERGHARSQRESRAQRICLNCPVLAQCREYALSAGELYGTWGGMTEADRKRHAGWQSHDEHRLSHRAAVCL
ncbi:WhiB family transcriptional regulator [Rhodococcus erythropolis]|uniref:WhiB family transcriptional regulator n=1 Tax=Rhodococcus erythropolis TaxID=1833 RepID=UPI000995BB4D|nr:WhiB family transcriptional regulator [Rhodococcus erythropolis]MBT1258517.1 WhiB family transcriptional regulator [Rhodococcus erythropolis]